MNATTITITPRMKRLIGTLLGMGIALALTAGSCDDSGNTKASNASSDNQYSGQSRSNQALTNFQSNPQNQYDPNKLHFSTELNNLDERLARYNDPSKISYIYLLSQTGSVISYY